MSEIPEILVIGQDPLLCNAIAAQLTSWRCSACTPAEAPNRLKSMENGLVILDEPMAIAFPRPLPVIQLVSRATDIEASVILKKPLSRSLLLSTVKRLLTAKETVSLAGISLLVSEKQLRDKSGETLDLTEKEVALIQHLARAGGKPIPRETLLGEIWGYGDDINTHTLETHIYRLRAKLEGWEPARNLQIETREGGYLLIIKD